MAAPLNMLASPAGFSIGRSFPSAATIGARSTISQDGARTAEARQNNADSLREQSQRNAEIQQLKARDRAVRAHELAHSSVGGRYAGAPNFTYERGPDGVLYAIAGEVPIDVSVIPGDPEATLDKMEIVRRAALAPVNPSAVDRAVAAQAIAQAARARAELARLEGDSQPPPGSNVDLLV